MAHVAPADPPRILPQAETVSIEIAAARLGLSRSKAYENAREQGALIAGVPVLRCGRKMLVPTRALDRVLFAEGVPAVATAE
jgi:hypothetical protein